MKTGLKYVLYVIVGIIALILALAAYFAATFNPNDYKQQIIDLVKEKKERTLKIEGDIKLSFWPKLGADLGQIALSEHQSNQEFASVRSVKVALAVIPLLKKELVVDTVYVDGASANIIKHKDGTTNFDDLLSQDESDDSQQIKFNIQGVKITDSKLSFNDEEVNANYRVDHFNMTAGQIALATPFDLDTHFELKANQPAIDSKVSIKGNFFADPEHKHFAVKALESQILGNIPMGQNMDIKASGNVDAKLESMEMSVEELNLAVSGIVDGAQTNVSLEAPALNILKEQVSGNKINLHLAQTKSGNDIQLNAVMADLKGSPAAIESSGISGDIAIKQDKRVITGKFSSPFKANLDKLIFDLPKLVTNLMIKDPTLPGGEANGNIQLEAHADIKNEQASSRFNLAVYETKMDGNIVLSGFKKQNIKFSLNADKLDLNKLLGKPTHQTSQKEKTASSAQQKPADLSFLDNMNLEGKIKINDILYDKYHVSGLNVGVTANGQKLALSGLQVKLDESQIKGAFSISQFNHPIYHFDLDIDQINLDRYISQAPSNADNTSNKGETSSKDTPIDLSALKSLNATGSVRIGKLNYGKTKLSNVRVDLKSEAGVAQLAPLSANLYNGSMQGALQVDARTTPKIGFKQELKSVAVGPLLADTINNDMLSGTGSVSLELQTEGNTVGAMKKQLAGNAALNLADGAIKGIDIPGKVRAIKSKVNMLKGQATETVSNSNEKTDFSELNASFVIKNGVAHNEDLAMKAPILRLEKGDSKGDIDIGNERINYVAKPTIVKSIKGQGGEDLNELAGITIPVKITGSFNDPKFGLDLAAVSTGLAKAKVLEKMGGDKGAAVQELMGGENKTDALKNLLGGKKKPTESTPDSSTTKPATGSEATGNGSTQEAPKSSKEQLKEEALKKLLNF